ncbi:uncharacterized protein LOC102808021 [Saccoglossus kowalevskii]
MMETYYMLLVIALPFQCAVEIGVTRAAGIEVTVERTTTDNEGVVICDEGPTYVSDESLTIVSPNHPAEYNIYDQCNYNIYTDEGYLIMLQFEEFDIEDSPNCQNDGLFIKDGDQYSFDLGVYCGQKAPDNIVTSGNRMTMNFLTDGSEEKTGFKAFVERVPDDGSYDATRKEYYVCGDHEATKSYGGVIISHAGYEKSQSPPKSNCSITIDPLQRFNRIQLTVLDVIMSSEKRTDITCVIEIGVRRPGGDITYGHHYKTAGAESCCQSCKATKGCKAWDFDNNRGDTEYGNCWLKDTHPYPIDAVDVVSGIIDPCTDQFEKVQLFEANKLLGGACYGVEKKTFMASSSLELRSTLKNITEGSNGFKAVFSLYYMAEDGRCEDKDFKCANDHCIVPYLSTDCLDHCGDMSDVNATFCIPLGKARLEMIIGVTFGVVVPVCAIAAFVLFYLSKRRDHRRRHRDAEQQEYERKSMEVEQQENERKSLEAEQLENERKRREAEQRENERRSREGETQERAGVSREAEQLGAIESKYIFSHKAYGQI